VLALASIFFGWWLTLAPQQLGGPVAIAVVKGTSMLGSLNSGDLIVAYRSAEYSKGDTVLYERYGGFVIHQIIGNNPDKSFITRGVNNEADDPWTVPKENILGKQLLVLPGFGKTLQAFVTNPMAVGITAVLAAFIIILPTHKTRNFGEAIKLHQFGVVEHVRFRGHRTILFWALTYTSAAVLAVVVVFAMSNAVFWPRIAIAIGVFLLMVFLLAVTAVYLFDGEGLEEPQKSMIILGPTLFRLRPDLKLEAEVQKVETAKELRAIKNELNTNVLHRVSSDGSHEFVVCGHAKNYVFTCQSSS
jgi:signal peptidase I